MRTLRAAAGTLLVLMLMSCSGAAQQPGVGATPSPFTFSGTLSLSGEIGLQGSFVDAVTLRRESCAQYAGGVAPATTLWVVPTPSSAENISGHSVSYTAGVPSAPPSSGYHGPRTYSTPSALISVLLVDNASFTPGDSAVTSIAVSANGSGSMTFSGMLDTATFASESGTVRWTCTS